MLAPEGCGKSILSMFREIPNIKFIQYSVRIYGQPELPKPKELKGVKRAFSVDYIYKKCRCPIFIKDNDVWVNHKDYFSSTMRAPTSDLGAPLSVLVHKYCNKTKNDKFVYADAWGSIVLRNEAWLCVENLRDCINRNCFELDILSEILRQQEKACNFDEYELECSDMSRFWENVIFTLLTIQAITQRGKLSA